MESNLFKRIKGKAVELKDNTVNYCKEHKVEIISGTITTLLGAGCAYLGFKNKELEETVAKTLSVNNYLESRNAYLQNDLEDAREHIRDLVDLCHQKDMVMNSTMSDGLRHGSSIAAQQMSYKRWSN